MPVGKERAEEGGQSLGAAGRVGERRRRERAKPLAVGDQREGDRERGCGGSSGKCCARQAIDLEGSPERPEQQRQAEPFQGDPCAEGEAGEQPVPGRITALPEVECSGEREDE